MSMKKMKDVIPNKISKKRHEKYVVVTKTHGVRMKGISIRGKVDGKSGGVSSLIKPKGAQGVTSERFILCDILVTIYNNQIVINAIYVFNECDNSRPKNVIDVILNVEVGTHAALEYGECCLYQFAKHVESHGIKPLICVPSLICCINSVQKKHIVSCDDEIGATPVFLTLSYILIVRTHLADIVIHIIALIDETGLVSDEQMLYGPMRSHIPKGFYL
ncbi:hypothetical protein KIW84_077070 [Lathyrus oleraceus]|uniref:Uncharacterized protein n=1 Tax=Pisum sativum TaxID=3888 RepID=A0A9D4W0V3_PEA|nr:hypothetical protein KIW84_077070 [Pisum sativum]